MPLKIYQIFTQSRWSRSSAGFILCCIKHRLCNIFKTLFLTCNSPVLPFCLHHGGPNFLVTGEYSMSRWLLQHLFGQYMFQCPEVNWVLNFPFTVNPTLCTLLVDVLCENYFKGFCMDHWWMPTLPWSVEYSTIFDGVVHQINFEIRCKLDTPSIIHFDNPLSLVVSASTHFTSSL